MSAEAVGRQMPHDITLQDLATMAGLDEFHRYEMSPEGVLSIMPPAGPEHALIVSRLFAWLVINGFTPEQLAADMGVYTGGARIPDLSVYAKDSPPRRAQSSYAGVDGMLVAVEVVSDGSKAMDWLIKRAEYAKAGIVNYWIVEQDTANTVHRLRLDPQAGEYVPAGDPQPLQWLLQANPTDLITEGGK